MFEQIISIAIDRTRQKEQEMQNKCIGYSNGSSNQSSFSTKSFSCVYEDVARANCSARALNFQSLISASSIISNQLRFSVVYLKSEVTVEQEIGMLY